MKKYLYRENDENAVNQRFFGGLVYEKQKIEVSKLLFRKMSKKRKNAQNSILFIVKLCKNTRDDY